MGEKSGAESRSVPNATAGRLRRERTRGQCHRALPPPPSRPSLPPAAARRGRAPEEPRSRSSRVSRGLSGTRCARGVGEGKNRKKKIGIKINQNKSPTLYFFRRRESGNETSPLVPRCAAGTAGLPCLCSGAPAVTPPGRNGNADRDGPCRVHWEDREGQRRELGGR